MYRQERTNDPIIEGGQEQKTRKGEEIILNKGLGSTCMSRGEGRWNLRKELDKCLKELHWQRER